MVEFVNVRNFNFKILRPCSLSQTCEKFLTGRYQFIKERFMDFFVKYEEIMVEYNFLKNFLKFETHF